MHKGRIDKTDDLARADVFDHIEAFTSGIAITAIRAASVPRPLNKRRRKAPFVYYFNASPLGVKKAGSRFCHTPVQSPSQRWLHAILNAISGDKRVQNSVTDRDRIRGVGAYSRLPAFAQRFPPPFKSKGRRDHGEMRTLCGEPAP